MSKEEILEKVNYYRLNNPNILFDEFITRSMYLPDEFVIFTNVLSTIIRDRNNVKIFMCGNTVNKYCPYYKEMGLNNVSIDPKDMAHIEAIVLSMTPYERKHPECLKATRKQRISKGCGRDVAEINRLLKQFEEMKKMMKMMSNGNMKLPF